MLRIPTKKLLQSSSKIQNDTNVLPVLCIAVFFQIYHPPSTTYNEMEEDPERVLYKSIHTKTYRIFIIILISNLCYVYHKSVYLSFCVVLYSR